MHRVGPYRFTEEDARHTFALAPALFDLLAADGEAAAVVAPFRARADRAAARRDEDADGALAEVWDAWRSAMAALRASGAFGPEASGEVVGLFRSDGGVPKLAVERVEIGYGGVAGDRQADRANHGRPFQAVCLWSAEVIDAFAADGHPLAPGRAGENVTVSGLPWPRVVPGARLRLGTALLEVSAYATPCRKNAGWFLDGRFDLMHRRHGPVSRVYATVVEPGTVALQDPAVLEPADLEPVDLEPADLETDPGGP